MYHCLSRLARKEFCNDIQNNKPQTYRRACVFKLSCGLVSSSRAPLCVCLCVSPCLSGSQKPKCWNQWSSKPVSRKEATRWGRLQRAHRGEKEILLHKQGLVRHPMLNSPKKSMEWQHWEKALKNTHTHTTHHIPSKQTSRATQFFQLEPQEGTGNGSV